MCSARDDTFIEILLLCFPVEIWRVFLGGGRGREESFIFACLISWSDVKLRTLYTTVFLFCKM